MMPVQKVLAFEGPFFLYVSVRVGCAKDIMGLNVIKAMHSPACSLLE